MGTCCAGWHTGTVRCRWARLPRVDPLCDRMERGEEEAVRAAAMHFSAAISADVKARSFRRAAAENCRPAIFEARATLREQSGSTLGRRVYQPSLSPFARNRGMSPFPISAIGDGLVARGFELVALVPGRHLVGLRDQPARFEADHRVFDHAVEYPLGGELVAGLVIDVLGPLVVFLFTPTRRLADVVGALVEVQRRHADLG